MAGVKLATPAALPGVSRTHGVRQWVGVRGRYLAQIGALAITYYIAAHVGYAFEFAGPVAAIVWLPVGVAISFLYLGGVGRWPGVLVGDLLVNDYSALRRLRGEPDVRQSARGAGRDAADAPAHPARRAARHCRGPGAMVMAFAAGAASARRSAPSSRLGAVIDTEAVPDVWRTWWLGDFAGALIVVPSRWPGTGRCRASGHVVARSRALMVAAVAARASSRSTATSPSPTSSFQP